MGPLIWYHAGIQNYERGCIDILNKFKRLAMLGAPLAVAGSVLAVSAAHADPLISSASSTAMLSSVSTNIWDVFYTNFPLLVGVVVLFVIVIGGTRWLLSHISSIGRSRK